MAELTHRFATTNGIRMHFVEVGTGPLVIMCHGHPECWYSWRHQLPALAEAGYRAVALDLRGYGQTDNPREVEAYSVLQVSGDLVGLVDALGEKKAVVVGHDLGAGLAQCAGLFRPDLFTAIALLSVPFIPRAKESPSQWEQRKYPGKVFYQQRYREPGFERVLDADPRAVILNGFYALSGEAEVHWSPARDQDEEPPPPTLNYRKPGFVSDEDIDFYANEMKRCGFLGGLNYYRVRDRNWELTSFLDGAKLLQPTLFVAGDRDPTLEFLREPFDEMEINVPNLRGKILLPGIGHWTQQESPTEINRLIIDFLAGL